MSGVVVIGVGNEFRHDDGVGPAVIDLLWPAVPGAVRLVSSDGEPTRMIEAWAGADLAVVVDAIRADPADEKAVGRLHRLAAEQATATPPAAVSSHWLGLGDAIRLAQALGRMPGRLIVHAVEVADCGYGAGLSPAVEAAAESVAAAVLEDLGITDPGPR